MVNNMMLCMCRNKDPIVNALSKVLESANFQNPCPRILEVASGTGQHVSHFAATLPHVSFQPTEISAEMLPRHAFFVPCSLLLHLFCCADSWHLRHYAYRPQMMRNWSYALIHVIDSCTEEQTQFRLQYQILVLRAEQRAHSSSLGCCF
jgi:hypothetical protein